jgi:hypothetical protein
MRENDLIEGKNIGIHGDGAETFDRMEGISYIIRSYYCLEYSHAYIQLIVSTTLYQHD